MKTFATFVEAVKSSKPKKVYFTFGRFNPPTKGHGVLIDEVKKLAKGNDYLICPSPNGKGEKNPLQFSDKVKFMKKMFPIHAKHISTDPSLNTAFKILAHLYKQGYTEVHFVVGADRVKEFTNLLGKYNGVDVPNKDNYYSFDVLKVEPSGDRTKGVSGTDLRNFAKNGDFESFKEVLPPAFADSPDAKKLFDKVRKALT